jgi:hypothetical protein
MIEGLAERASDRQTSRISVEQPDRVEYYRQRRRPQKHLLPGEVHPHPSGVVGCGHLIRSSRLFAEHLSSSRISTGARKHPDHDVEYHRDGD